MNTKKDMAKPKINEGYRFYTYDGYDHILSEVRYLIKTYVPADHNQKVLEKIDNLEVNIEETIAGRQEQYEQSIKDDFE
jgi:DNA-binding transcriptional MerR regulator